GKPETGWAIGGHLRREDRVAVFVPERPFGVEDGAKVRFRLKFESPFGQHQFGRVRLSLTKEDVPSSVGSSLTEDVWYALGSFPAHDANRAFLQTFDPEKGAVNTGQKFKIGETELSWQRKDDWRDGNETAFEAAANSAAYLYRNVTSFTKQRATFRLETGEGVKAWVNRQPVYANIATGGVAEFQAQLNPGNNELLIKLVNGDGDATFTYSTEREPVIVPAKVADAIALAAETRSEEQLASIREFYRSNVSEDGGIRDLVAQRGATQRERNELDAKIATTLVMNERDDRRQAFVLIRGAYDKHGDPVSPNTPSFLPPMREDLKQTETPARLALAKWLLDPSHPLTARVTVNRMWLQVFGKGIVRTAEDFGSQGTPPTHPLLLDYLATEFVDGGWDVKGMMKRLVMSGTYRQSARVDTAKLERDPKNDLYWRAPRYRLDAEMMRDQALALSGLLVPKIGGPSVKPPQPDGLWEAVGYVGSNTAKFSPDTELEKVHRRSLYTFWKRTSPPPQMAILDAPSREACSVRRERTNTPMQALMLMNDPQYVEAARVFAQRTLKQGGETTDERLVYAFEAATARVPSEREMAILRATLDGYLAEYQGDAEEAGKLIAVGAAPAEGVEDPTQLAAWTMMMNLILNLDEVINKG
ncbi:MAG: DUF1553 domain-containing protein, partial [Candidatus Poribacteria bacterium]|nr:DUF1553 domain-containing protein [Candidatus Poribacteria bacterium]